MRVIVLYRQKSEQRQDVEEFVRSFKSRYPDAKVVVEDVDSRDGWSTASLYDIVRYPAVMVVKDDGYLQQLWEGDDLPLLDEVRAYVRV